jgi:hypothetical protein
MSQLEERAPVTDSGGDAIERPNNILRLYHGKFYHPIPCSNEQLDYLVIFTGGCRDQKPCSFRCRDERRLCFPRGGGTCVRCDALADWYPSLGMALRPWRARRLPEDDSLQAQVTTGNGARISQALGGRPFPLRQGRSLNRTSSNGRPDRRLQGLGKEPIHEPNRNWPGKHEHAQKDRQEYKQSHGGRGSLNERARTESERLTGQCNEKVDPE